METLSAHAVPNLPTGDKRQYQNVKMSESGAASVALDAASNARRGDDADRGTIGHDNQQHQQQQQQDNVQAEQSEPSQSRVDSQQTPGSTSAGFRSYASGGAPASAPGSQDSTFSSGGGSNVGEWSPLKTSMAAPGRVERRRVGTPEEQAMGRRREANTATSPLAATSPSTRHKRTASGLVKSASTVSTVSTVSPVYGAGESPGREMRAESVSSSGSRAGEAAIQLKTRLAYAMAKVQHGWQNHNLDQVEVLAASLTPRTTFSSPAASGNMAGRNFVSPRTALSTGASRLNVRDSSPQARDSPPSKRRSGAGIVSWAGSDTIIPSSKPHQPHHPQPQLHRRANSRTGLSLAPAADIRPLASTPSHPLHRRSLSNMSSKSDGSISRPFLLRNNSTEEAVTKPYPGSQPQTPRSKPSVVGALQSTNITTAQAEQDAMDALMLMGGSPSGKQKSTNNFYPSSSSQPLPSSIDTGARHGNGLLLSASQPPADALRRPSASQTSSLQPSPLRSGFLADGLSDKDQTARAASFASSSGDAAEGESPDGGESEDGVPDSQGSAIREAREKVLDEVEEMAS